MRALAWICFALLSANAFAFGTIDDPDQAPKNGTCDHSSWSTAIKQIFGTSYESYDDQNQYSYRSSTAPISKVWFTGGHGILTEVFWPTVDTPQVKDSQFLVTDGKTFFFEEGKDSQTDVEWIQPGVPAFHILNRDPQGRFAIDKKIFTDPDRDVVIQQISITRFVPGLKFFILHNPAVGNTPMGNSALASAGQEPDTPGVGLFAWQDDQAQALITSVPFKKVSAGFFCANDGWQDIHQDLQMDYHYKWALNGDVVLTGWLDLPETVGVSNFDLLLGFGRAIQDAYQSATATLAAGTDGSLSKYISEWQSYQNSILDLTGTSEDQGKLFRSSVAILKSMEDKTFAGAFIASPTIPWGEHQKDDNALAIKGGSRTHQVGGYHLVWPRDLYQMATSFMAINDDRSALASLNHLKSIQLGPSDGNWEYGFRKHSRDGSFWQNGWVSGEAFWGGLQMDEVAMPVILTYRLWKSGKIDWRDYWDMVRRAADFINEFGPWTPQERWEEIFGASPSSIAAQISALWTAAVLAEQAGDMDRARKYRATGDAWEAKPGDNVENWTFTQNGPYGNGRYFIRIAGAGSYDEIWNPNGDYEINVANGAGKWKEKALVDGGFLELVRYGVRSPLAQSILDTLQVYDSTIRVDVPGKGPGFFRYLGDRYNYDDSSGVQTKGMIWPFLSGERGHYELARALAVKSFAGDPDQAILPYLKAMENFATPTQMLPEQVWDAGDFAGMPTGAATPLGWTHGEYIKLLRSRHDHQVFDFIPLVAFRAQGRK